MTYCRMGRSEHPQDARASPIGEAVYGVQGQGPALVQQRAGAHGVALVEHRRRSREAQTKPRVRFAFSTEKAGMLYNICKAPAP